MKICQAIKLVGNNNRVDEMHQAGCSDALIAFVFQENNMMVTEEHIRNLNEILPVFKNKALSKKAARQAILAVSIMKDPSFEKRAAEELGVPYEELES